MCLSSPCRKDNTSEGLDMSLEVLRVQERAAGGWEWGAEKWRNQKPVVVVVVGV
jgi:hypothetical protein